MTYGQEILLAGVTDYASALEKNNAEKLASIDLYDKQVADYYTKRTKKAQDESLVKIAELGANFSSTLMKIKNATKGSAALAKNEERNKNLEYLYENFKGGEIEAVNTIIGDAFEEGKLLNDLTNFKIEVEKLRERGAISKDTAKILTDNHGGTLLKTQRALGWHRILNGEKDFQEYISTDGDANLIWEGDDYTEKGKLYSNFMNNLLQDIGLSDRYIVRHFKDSILKRSTTKEIVEQLKFTKRVIQEDSAELDNAYDNATTAFKDGTGNPHELTRLTSEAILTSKKATIALAKNDVTLRLYRLGATRKLSTADLKAIKTGLVKHESGDIIVTEDNKDQYPDFEVGDKLGKGELLLSTKQWNQIQSGIDQAIDAENKAIVAERNTAFAAGINEYLQTGDPQKKLDVQAAYLAAGGLETDEKYKSFENMNFSHQSEEVYKVDKARTDEIIRAGTAESYDSAIANTQNIKLQEELKLDKQKFEASKKLSNMKNDDITKITTQSIHTSSAKTISATKGLTLSGIPVNDYLESKINRIYAEVYAANGSNPALNIKTEVLDKYMAEVTAEGLFEKPTSNNKGILTPDVEGNYPRFKAGAIKENRQGDDIAKTTNTIRTALKENPDLSIEEIMDKSGSILKEDELISFKQFNWNPKTKTITSLTPDILLKSQMLGVLPSELVERQLKAFIANPDNKDIVDQFKLNDLVGNIPTPDQELKKFLEENDSKDILSKFRFEPTGITYKNIQELLKIEAAAKTRENKVTTRLNNKLTSELRSMGYEDEAITELIGQGEAARIVKENRKISAKLKAMGYEDEAIQSLWDQGLAISEYQKYASDKLFNQ